MNAMRIYIPFLASLTPLTLYLLGHGSKNLFSAYMAMTRNGYLLGPYGIELPSDWSKRLYARRPLPEPIYHRISTIMNEILLLDYSNY